MGGLPVLPFSSSSADNTITGLCTGPDLGFDGTGALRVTSARQMPIPPLIVSGGGWTNGLRQDPSNGAWAAQCAPTPFLETFLSSAVIPVAGGVLTTFSPGRTLFQNISQIQALAFLGDVQFDALVATNGSAIAEMWPQITYEPTPGGPTYSSPLLAQATTVPNIIITPAMAASGSQSFLWRAQVKLGLGLWLPPANSQVPAFNLGIKNVLDNAPSTPFPLEVIQWSVAVSGLTWLIDPTPVT